MTRDCLTPQMLERWNSMSEVERHASDCPRCYALLESYRSFVAAEVVDGARVAAAERELDQFLKSRVARAPRRRRTLIRRVVEPAAWVAAIAALVIFAVIPRLPSAEDNSGLRAVQPERLQLLSPQPAGDGWLLRWDFVESADHYELRLYTLGLDEIRRFGELTEPEFQLSENVPDGKLWRVYAYDGSEVVAVSAVGTLGED